MPTFFPFQHIVVLSLTVLVTALCFFVVRHIEQTRRMTSLSDDDMFETGEMTHTPAADRRPPRSSIHHEYVDEDEISHEFSVSSATSSPSQPRSWPHSIPQKNSHPDPICPKCQSKRVDIDNRARKAGGLIGTMAGSTSAMAYALSGAETGMTVGRLVGPTGMMLGGLAGAIIAGLIGGAVGCKAGAAVGEVIDATVLNNYRCLSCGHHFSKRPYID